MTQHNPHNADEPIVRILQASEWQLYRELRLRALRDSPDAFGATLAQEQTWPDDFWSARLGGASASTDLPLIAEVDGSPGGLSWGRIEPGQRDTAHLYQMWVAPECRGLGIGSRLLQSVIDWAGSHNAGIVLLNVSCGNPVALKLYITAGFIPAGEPEPLRPGSELLAQPMKLTLQRG